MPQERVVQMPPKDFAVFQKLEGEVGKLTNLLVLETRDADAWYNPDLESSEMAVRATIRNAILEKLGYADNRDLIPEEENIAEGLDQHPEIKSALGTPDFMHYKWEKVSAENMGRFSKMSHKGKALIDVKNGVVLFADEVQKLLRGEPVITLHSSGFQLMGFLAERKDVYKVIGGNLNRIRGLIID